MLRKFLVPVLRGHYQPLPAMKKMLPVIGITMGDPAGIGPEIIGKMLMQPRLPRCIPVILGASACFPAAGRIKNLRIIKKLPERLHENGMYLLDNVSVRHTVTPGRPSKATGEAAVAAIKLGVTHALRKQLDAIVTAPISKESMHMAGYHYQGHTELLQELTGAEDALMIFAGGKLLVALLTTHVAVNKISQHISQEKILQKVKTIQQGFQKYVGARPPRIGICALNPHASDGGIFGNEEEKVIRPAIKKLQQRGFHVEGPVPADTIFRRNNLSVYQVILAMYHDQGMVPVKLLGGGHAVNVTWGLPIIRTSPDHGTAFDIAGQHKADAGSIMAALRMAVKMVKRQRFSSN